MGCASSKSCQSRGPVQQTAARLPQRASDNCTSPKQFELIISDQQPAEHEENVLNGHTRDAVVNSEIPGDNHDQQPATPEKGPLSPKPQRSTSHQRARFDAAQRALSEDSNASSHNWSIAQTKIQRSHKSVLSRNSILKAQELLSTTEVQSRSATDYLPGGRVGAVDLDQIGMSAAFCQYMQDKISISGSSSEQSVAAVGWTISAADRTGVSEDNSGVMEENSGNNSLTSQGEIQQLENLLYEIDSKPSMLLETIRRRRDFDKRYSQLLKHTAARAAPMGTVQDQSNEESSESRSSGPMMPSQRVKAKPPLTP
eukprot:gnl/TRDRNA2_/TRDRNA2_177019_c1_seq3.p1 gnl/TRDRNA2_/TRDRNA2_177019_c1~~gnl/TRDRNA2_/TRDRNA2_177019_c1_seq3.p1  ORF type:complete len:329 (+),score=35.74 gnl/TRDRNA2_/TRDRNA2_177019_c1_seq3:49-987(+)